MPAKERATGIILRTRLLTESSLIVEWLTRGLGRLATVAKGARRPKSAFRGKLDLYYEADFSFARSRRSQLHTLEEVSLRHTNTALRESVAYLRQAGYCAQLLEQSTEVETPIASLFELFADFLSYLPAKPASGRLLFAFELKLLIQLGLQPDWSKTQLTDGAKAVLLKLAALDWSLLDRVQLSKMQHREIRQFLHGFIIYHLGRIPPGRAAALQDEV